MYKMKCSKGGYLVPINNPDLRYKELSMEE